MIIAIYGMQRSGKTTLIEDILKKNDVDDVVHVKPSLKMFEIMREMFGKDKTVKDLTEEEADLIVKRFSSYIKELSSLHNYVVCDCHYGYLLDGSPSRIHPIIFHYSFDLYFYLDTDASVILQRMIKTNGQKCEYDFNLFSIQQLKEYEKKELSSILAQRNKELHCLNSDSYTAFLNELGGMAHA